MFFIPEAETRSLHKLNKSTLKPHLPTEQNNHEDHKEQEKYSPTSIYSDREENS